MQGILMSHFNQVKKYLYDLRQLEQFKLPCNHLTVIVDHEIKLAEIYENYKTALFQVEILIKEFDEHKKSVRRLIMEHKRCKKLVRLSTQVINANNL